MKTYLLALLCIALIGCGAEQLPPVDLSDPILGPENASITVVEYSDFQCPYCGDAAGYGNQLDAAVPGLKKLAEEGKIKLVFKHFPLANHQYAQKAAEAAEAANAQGAFWEYHNLLFQNQDGLSMNDLIKYAEELGLDAEKFETELKGNVYSASVKKDISEGTRAGVRGTPSFVINGKLFEGAQPFSVLNEEIERIS